MTHLRKMRLTFAIWRLFSSEWELSFHQSLYRLLLSLWKMVLMLKVWCHCRRCRCFCVSSRLVNDVFDVNKCYAFWTPLFFVASGIAFDTANNGSWELALGEIILVTLVCILRERSGGPLYVVDSHFSGFFLIKSVEVPWWCGRTFSGIVYRTPSHSSTGLTTL